jgi:hypothetical protein
LDITLSIASIDPEVIISRNGVSQEKDLMALVFA